MEDRSIKVNKFIETWILIHKCIASAKENPLKRYSLNRQQLEVLYILYFHGKTTMKEIASLTKTTKGAATQIINTLVKDNYLERIYSDKDRRVIHLAFSQYGLKRFTSLRKEHLKYMSTVLSDLTNEELTYVITIQEKILNKINNYNLDKQNG